MDAKQQTTQLLKGFPIREQVVDSRLQKQYHHNCKNAGPHVLDIDTVYCVIEYALSGSHSSKTSSNPSDTPREKSVFNSHIINSSPILLREEDMEDDYHQMEEYLLNVLASKVLHTSNQQIIDHLIDNLLSTPTDG